MTMIAEDLLARWRAVPPAIAADVSKGACVIDPAIRPLRPAGQQPRLFGTAVTAVCQPPDFGAVLRAIDEMKPGNVLVIDAQGHSEHAMLGEILGGHLRRLKCAGIVCDGAIRDVAELAGWDDLSVYARSITPNGPQGIALGLVNGAARVGGLSVKPGDLLIGDDDGLVALTPELANLLIEPALAKMALEAEWQAKLKSGLTLTALFNL